MLNAGYLMIEREISLLRELDVLANNVANAKTPSFKAQVLVNQQNSKNSNTDASYNEPVSLIDYSPGPVTKTDRALDVALQSDGFFMVRTPLGVRYTRAGNFSLDENNQLVDASSFPVLTADQQPLVISGDGGTIKITKNGTISSSNGELGRIGVVEFSNMLSLRPVGKYLYQSDVPPEVNENAIVQQGFIEESNVNSIRELSNLIETQRSATIANNFVNNIDDMERNTIKTLVNISK